MKRQIKWYACGYSDGRHGANGEHELVGDICEVDEKLTAFKKHLYDHEGGGWKGALAMFRFEGQAALDQMNE